MTNTLIAWKYLRIDFSTLSPNFARPFYLLLAINYGANSLLPLVTLSSFHFSAKTSSGRSSSPSRAQSSSESDSNKKKKSEPKTPDSKQVRSLTINSYQDFTEMH